MSGFLTDRRRRVLHIAGAYIAIAWLVTEVAGFLMEQAGAPVWVLRLLAIVFVVGFPVSVALAWLVQKRPEGGWSLDSSKGQGGPVLLTMALGVVVTAGLAWLILPRIEDVPPLPAYDHLPNSVAILPFFDIDSTPTERTVAEALYTALLEGLNQSRELTQVRLRLDEKPRDLLALGRRTRVAALLVGRILQDRGRTRVELELLDVGRDRTRWSQVFDWDSTQIMDTGTAIANGVLEAMNLPVMSQEKFVGTDNLEAYEAFLMGGQLAASFNVARLAGAMDEYQRAIELDPGYVLAYVALAETIGAYISIKGPSKEERRTLQQRREQVVETVLAIDDETPAVISLLGSYAQGREVRIQAYEQALELDPGHAPSYFRLGRAMIAGEKRDEGLKLIHKAIELDPLNAWYHSQAGWLLYNLGRDEEAANEFRKSIEFEPGLASNYTRLAAIQFLSFGRFDEAIINYRRAYALDPQAGQAAGFTAYMYAYLGAPEEAFAWMERGVELGPTNDSAWEMALIVQDRFGRREEALETARQILEMWPSNRLALYELGRHDIARGRAVQALERWDLAYPVFDLGEELDFNFFEVEAALLFSTNLMEAGEKKRARQLLQRCQAYLEEAQRRDESHIQEPWIHALLGQKEETLEALRRAIDANFLDEGMLFDPWFFDFVRDDPEFQRLQQIVKAELAGQLQRVREMERNGEMPPAPGVEM